MKCRKCGRTLKNPQSVINSMGPVCYRKWLSKLGLEEAQPDQSLLTDEMVNPDVVLRRTAHGVATNVPHSYVSHSPTGFEWGYGGSGPADLALNILIKFGLSREDAYRLHQKFKWEFIGGLPKEGGVIPAATIREWISNHPIPAEPVA